MWDLHPFSAALERLFASLEALTGVALRWKDADERLRLAMPRHLVEHLHPRCLAVKARDQRSRERCVRHCRIPAAAWTARRPPARLSTCHGGCGVWRIPVGEPPALLGTLSVGPFRRGGGASDLPPVPPALEAALALAAEAIPRLAAERARERADLDRQALHPALRTLARLLQEGVRHDQPAATYARRCGLSVSRLQHLCTAALGEPLGRLHQRALLRQAQAALLGPATIQRIATGLGFRDQRYFATWFRRWAGSSPGAWRRSRAARDDA